MIQKMHAKAFKQENDVCICEKEETNDHYLHLIEMPT